MRKILFVVVSIVILMPGLSNTQTQSAETGKEKGMKTDELSRVLDRYYEDWNKMNVEDPAKYYSKDPDLIFYDVLPMQYHGWKEYSAGVKKLFENFESLKLTKNDDVRITRVGKVAWSTLTFRLAGKGKEGNPDLDVICRHTAIWQKIKGDWLVVHEHISVPMPSGESQTATTK